MTDRTAEEWGRVAVGLPGFEWAGGMLDGKTGERMSDHGGLWWCMEDEQGHPWWPDDNPPGEGHWPDPDDGMTAGGLLEQWNLANGSPDVFIDYDCLACVWSVHDIKRRKTTKFPHERLGRACIAAAEALGRWPGGK